MSSGVMAAVSPERPRSSTTRRRTDSSPERSDSSAARMSIMRGPTQGTTAPQRTQRNERRERTENGQEALKDESWKCAPSLEEIRDSSHHHPPTALRSSHHLARTAHPESVAVPSPLPFSPFGLCVLCGVRFRRYCT